MNKRTLAFCAFLVCLAGVIVVTFVLLDIGARGQQRAPKRYSEIPEITSSVEGLEIEQTSLKDAGTLNAVVVIQLRNTSGKPIVAVDIESGNENDSSGQTVSGFHDGALPASIIAQPNETLELEFPLANVLPGSPIRIGGVMYADGTEEGEERILKIMHGRKEYRKPKRTEGSPQ